MTGINSPPPPPPTGGGNPTLGGTAEPGWISGITNNQTVSGVIALSVQAGVTLTDGTLSYAAASNPAARTVLNPNTTGTR